MNKREGNISRVENRDVDTPLLPAIEPNKKRRLFLRRLCAESQ